MADYPDSESEPHTPPPLRSQFRDHKECDWIVQQSGVKGRTYDGEVYPVILLADRSCTTVESLPVTGDGQYVAIGDSLRRDMGWGKKVFNFAYARFYRMGTDEENDAIGHYMPTFYHLTSTGQVCKFD
jgi:hypothetical protein